MMRRCGRRSNKSTPNLFYPPLRRKRIKTKESLYKALDRDFCLLQNWIQEAWDSKKEKQIKSLSKKVIRTLKKDKERVQSIQDNLMALGWKDADNFLFHLLEGKLFIEGKIKMIDMLGDFFLAFSRDTVFISLIILGSLWGDRKIFYSVTCLMLFTIIFSPCLKLTFQVPLSPSLGKEGFAFPSGHMQATTVLYGWILYHIPHVGLRLTLAFLLGGIGISLIHFGYHDFYDVLGGIFFAIVSMVVYKVMERKMSEKNRFWLLSSLATAGLFYISFRSHQISLYTWMGYYAFIGFVGSSLVLKKKADFSLSFSHKIGASCFYLASFLAIYFIFPLYFRQLQWLLIGMIIPPSILFDAGDAPKASF